MKPPIESKPTQSITSFARDNLTHLAARNWRGWVNHTLENRHQPAPTPEQALKFFREEVSDTGHGALAFQVGTLRSWSKFVKRSGFPDWKKALLSLRLREILDF